jgi:hypothetical protein
MRTRLQAIQSATIVNDFDSFAQLVAQVVQYYTTTTTTDDEDKAVSALDAFVARGKQNNMHVDAQLDTLLGELFVGYIFGSYLKYDLCYYRYLDYTKAIS